MWDLPLRSAALSGLDPNATTFAIELTHNGGTGARPGADGLSATGWPSGVWGSQVEVTESTVPVRVRRRELIPDSGGAGRQRGGLGQIIELESSEGRPIEFFASLERMKYPARGRAGGAAGRLGRACLRSGPRLAGKGEHTIPEGDLLIFETPGGGGYGDPLARRAEAVAADVAKGAGEPGGGGTSLRGGARRGRRARRGGDAGTAACRRPFRGNGAHRFAGLLSQQLVPLPAGLHGGGIGVHRFARPLNRVSGAAAADDQVAVPGRECHESARQVARQTARQTAAASAAGAIGKPELIVHFQRGRPFPSPYVRFCFVPKARRCASHQRASGRLELVPERAAGRSGHASATRQSGQRNCLPFHL